MNKIAIFKAGTHTATNGDQLSATPDWLRELVATYQPQLHEAPAVIGHPADNAPAYGWVKALSFDDKSGTLYADFEQVEPTFAELLKAGRFKKRSASFYPPTHPSNPTPGKPYLRHVGFLGAQPPAVKGLPDFSDDANVAVYEFSEPETQSQTQAQGDTMPDDNTNADLAAKEKELEAREAELNKREAELKAKEEALQAEQERKAQEEAADFADSLIQKGKLLPNEKAAVVSVMLNLDKDSTFDFAEGGSITKKPTVSALKSLLERLPVTVDFSERAGNDPNQRELPQVIGAVDESKAEQALNTKIQNFAETHGLTFAQAAAIYEE